MSPNIRRSSQLGKLCVYYRIRIALALSLPHPPPRSLNRQALDEVLQQESAPRPVCGSRSEATTKCSRPNGSPKGKRSAATPSSPPSHPSLFDILLIFFNLPRKQYKNLRKQYKEPRTQYTAKIVFVPGIQCLTEKYPHFSLISQKIQVSPPSRSSLAIQ